MVKRVYFIMCRSWQIFVSEWLILIICRAALILGKANRATAIKEKYVTGFPYRYGGVWVHSGERVCDRPTARAQSHCRHRFHPALGHRGPARHIVDDSSRRRPRCHNTYHHSRRHKHRLFALYYVPWHIVCPLAARWRCRRMTYAVLWSSALLPMNENGHYSRMQRGSR